MKCFISSFATPSKIKISDILKLGIRQLESVMKANN